MVFAAGARSTDIPLPGSLHGDADKIVDFYTNTARPAKSDTLGATASNVAPPALTIDVSDTPHDAVPRVVGATISARRSAVQCGGRGSDGVVDPADHAKWHSNNRATAAGAAIPAAMSVLLDLLGALLGALLGGPRVAGSRPAFAGRSQGACLLLLAASWIGGAAATDAAVEHPQRSLLSTHCDSLAKSMTGNSKLVGCAGAVWSDGTVSSKYCSGDSGRYPWWAACCKWKVTTTYTRHDLACNGRNELGFQYGSEAPNKGGTMTVDKAKEICDNEPECVSFEHGRQGTFQFSSSCTAAAADVRTTKYTLVRTILACSRAIYLF
jgi:hypothetical protein